MAMSIIGKGEPHHEAKPWINLTAARKFASFCLLANDR